MQESQSSNDAGASLPALATTPEQVQLYRAAMDAEPKNGDLLRQFCYSCHLFTDDVVAVLRQRLATLASPPTLRADELMLLAFARERQERKKRGLPLNSATGIGDTFFQFTGPELMDFEAAILGLLQERPGYYFGAQSLANLLVARGEIVRAEALFAQIRPYGKPNTDTVTSFDPAFHAGLLESARRAVAEELPPLHWVKEFEATPARAVVVSGDYRYFLTYGWPLVASFRSHGEDIGLVLHIMDMTPEESAGLAAQLSALKHPWALSTEWTGLRTPDGSAAAREYYHAVRFSRLHQLLERHPAMAVWQVDMDELFNGPPSALFGLLKDADIGAFMMPGRMEVRNKISAHMLGVAATPLGRTYIGRVAGYIAAFRRQKHIVWGIDQVALFAVMVMMLEEGLAPRATVVPPALYDESYAEDKILWCAKVQEGSFEAQKISDRLTGWMRDFGPASSGSGPKPLVPAEAVAAEHVQQWRDALAGVAVTPAMLTTFARACERRFNDELIATLEERLAKPSSSVPLRTTELLLCATAKERRRRKGLPPANAIDVPDIFFHAADKELTALEALAHAVLAQAPDHHSMKVVLANALICRRRFAAAETVIAGLRGEEPLTTEAAASFDPVFHAGLLESARRAVAELPPLRWVKEFDVAPARAVVVAGDYRYFLTYGWPLVASFGSHGEDIGLVLHIMDMTPEESADVAGKLDVLKHPWALSTEWTGLRTAEISEAAREYYHAVRFPRLHQLLERYPATAAWQVDMDELFNGPPSALLDLLKDADMSAFMMPARLEARSKVAAHMVGVAATPLGRTYIGRVAGYIAALRREKRMVWGVDQVALFAVMAMMLEEGLALRAKPVPAALYDESYTDDKILWCANPSDDPAAKRRLAARTAAWMRDFPRAPA